MVSIAAPALLVRLRVWQLCWLVEEWWWAVWLAEAPALPSLATWRKGMMARLLTGCLQVDLSNSLACWRQGWLLESSLPRPLPQSEWHFREWMPLWTEAEA